MSGRKMFFGLFDKKQLSVMKQNDDTGLLRPVSWIENHERSKDFLGII